MEKTEEMFMKSDEYKRALDVYRRAQKDPHWKEGYLGDFVREVFVERSGHSIKASEIHKLYSAWACVNDKPALGQRNLGMGLRTMLQTKRMGDGIYYLGIKENGFREPYYQLLSKVDGETDGKYYDKKGVVEFLQDYWNYKNEGEELPEKLNNPSLEEIREELDRIGVVANAEGGSFVFGKI